MRGWTQLTFAASAGAAQEALRRRAIVLVEQKGMSQACGGQGRWRAAADGQPVAEALPGVGRGRPPGRAAGLRAQGPGGADRRAGAAGPARWIAEKTPDQLKLPFALWTSRAVRELIERRFGQRLGLSTVQLYLKRWGMTPQKPLMRATQRSPAAVAAWLARDYPAIARRARRERAVVFYRADETGISNQDQIGRSYAPRGRTPGGWPDRQADHPEHDLGGLQPRPDALHAVRGRARRRSVPHLPAPADQGRRAEGVPDRRQPEGAPRQKGQSLGRGPIATRSSCSTSRPTRPSTTRTNT